MNQKTRQIQVLETKQIPIGELVPGELVLENDVIETLKLAIKSGFKVQAPRVTLIGSVYYVLDGNHRIMALKELGYESITCRIQPHRPTKGSADYDADMCNRAIQNGHQGFNGLTRGSKAEKERAYAEEEDDDLFSEIE